MELVLGRKSSFLEGISVLFQRKGDNVLREEGIEVKEAAESATRRLRDCYLSKCCKNDDILTVIDPYFLKTPKGNDATSYAKRIIDLLSVENFVLIQIITNHVDPDVKKALETQFNSLGSAKIVIHGGIDDFHDRFYISLRRDQSMAQGIVVGTSFNHIGNKIYLVADLCPDNICDVENELKKIGHTISPCLS